jgi:hypothetical protein
VIRRLFTLLSALALLLCVATCWLWVRQSNSRNDRFTVVEPGVGYLAVYSHVQPAEEAPSFDVHLIYRWPADVLHRGVAWDAWSPGAMSPSYPPCFYPYEPPRVAGWSGLSVRRLRVSVNLRADETVLCNEPGDDDAGFDVGPVNHSGKLSSWRLHATFPWAVGAFAVLPVTRVALAAVHFRRRRVRRMTNGCVHCGYDLRASPDRCPECGAVPAAKGAA